jgi:signal transduction histidine kinase
MMSNMTSELERIASFQAQLGEPQSRSLQSVQLQLNSIAEDLSVLVDRDNPSTRLLGSSKRAQISNDELLPDRLITIYQQISSEYSHAVKTPLASVETALKNVKKQLPLVIQGDGGPSEDKVRLLHLSLENASLSIEDIKAILRHGAGFLPENATRFSIQKIVGRAIAMTKEATGLAPQVSSTVGALPDVKYYESNLLIAILQVIENAFEATGPQGQLRIEGELNDAKEVSILVTNTHNGKTISPRNRDQIFESGFSTKKQGRGVGLALARRSLDRVKGKIILEDSNDQETTFRILIRPEEIYSSLEATHG